MTTFREFFRGSIRVDGMVLANHVILGGSAVSITTTGPATLTPAQLLAGLIRRDPNGDNRADVLPTAADLANAIHPAIGSRAAGQHFEFSVRNEADAAETITLTAPSAAVTLSGTMTVARGECKRFRAELTAGASGAEAYTVYAV